MKIVYYTDCSLENNDGPAVNEQEFLLQLKNKYDNNFLFVTVYKNKAFCKIHDIDNVCFFEEVKLSSIKQKIDYVKLALKLSRKDFDIMVCRLTDIPFIPFLIKFFNKKKKIAIKTAALWYVDDIKSTRFLDKIFIKIRDVIYLYLYRRADVIDTALPYAKADLIKEFNIPRDKIFHIENGINTNKFSLGTDASLKEMSECWPVLGFMGSLPSSRGALQILEVAKRIINTYPALGVLILGYDPALDAIVKSLSSLGVQVTAPGKVSYSTIEKYVKAMTIGFSFYEEKAVEICGNASQKVRQYLACGKPVFSIHHNHQFIVDNDLGAIFHSNDYNFMAQEIIQWINRIEKNNSEISNRLRAYAVKHFSVESTFKKRLGIYKSILKDT